MNTASPSWSGFSRPSTSLLVEGGVQGVDARHKDEHDGWRSVVFMGSGLGPSARPGMTGSQETISPLNAQRVIRRSTSAQSA